MDDRPLPIVHDTTGLSLGYRLRWWIRYCALYVFGPAEHSVGSSPRERMKWERARKVRDAHYARGTLPDGETIETVARLEQ